MKTPVLTFLIASLLGACVTVPPPPNCSAADPADSSAREAGSSRYQPNLIASTRIFLDPSVGEGAQKMDHSKMHGMGGMEGMDHSKMQSMEGMDHSKPGETGAMEGMDHSKMPGMQGNPGADQAKPQSMESMPGMSGKKDGTMPAMKHDAEPTKAEAVQPADKAATLKEMQQTAEEMKKTSDELKAKSDGLQKRRGTAPVATPPSSPTKPEDHSQHPH